MSRGVTEAELVDLAAKAYDDVCTGKLPHLNPLQAVVEVIVAALAAEPGAAEDWRDMNSAPKDGTFIITRATRWARPAVVHWATYEGVTKWGGDPEGFMEEHHFLQYWIEVQYEPTEWLPLETLDEFPAAPRLESSK